MANVSFTSLIKEALRCNEWFLHKPYCLFSSVLKAYIWEFKLKQQQNPSACKENSWGLNACACSASTVLVYVCANPQGSPQRTRKNTLASIRGAVSQTQRRCLQGRQDTPRMVFMIESSWGRHSKLLHCWGLSEKSLRACRELPQTKGKYDKLVSKLRGWGRRPACSSSSLRLLMERISVCENHPDFWCPVSPWAATHYYRLSSASVAVSVPVDHS